MGVKTYISINMNTRSHYKMKFHLHNAKTMKLEPPQSSVYKMLSGICHSRSRIPQSPHHVLYKVVSKHPRE